MAYRLHVEGEPLSIDSEASRFHDHLLVASLFTAYYKRLEGLWTKQASDPEITRRINRALELSQRGRQAMDEILDRHERSVAVMGPMSKLSKDSKWNQLPGQGSDTTFALKGTLRAIRFGTGLMHLHTDAGPVAVRFGDIETPREVLIPPALTTSVVFGLPDNPGGWDTLSWSSPLISLQLDISSSDFRE